MRQLLYRLLGRRNVKSLYWLAQRVLRGRRPQFSEAELILDYFAARPGGPGFMFDVGVHYGESAKPYTQMGWQVIGFEPDPANRAKIPPLRGLKLYENAVADQAGLSVPFYASEVSTGVSSLSSFLASHRPVATVTTVTLAQIVEQDQVKQVDFLKIDIEGHDLFALRGFPFAQLQPEVILCEFEDHKTVPNGYTYQQLGDFLVAQGYQVYLSEWHPIVQYGTQHQWRRLVPYPARLADARGWGNFVAVRPREQAVWHRAVARYLKFIGADAQSAPAIP
jgi:FkbM family methyltransferase